ncbi:MAG: hypothetical protein JXN59_16105 [Anaerolineae bacterium]|nr:hypothetical protein [Anaerolineae bacterium]
MTTDNQDSHKLDWLDEFEDLANIELSEGSACAQVHPIMERWLDELLENDPPESRDAVWQAMSCLTTEILFKLTPDNILEVLEEHFEEEEIAMWLESVVLIGRAFQKSLDNGELDDL